MRSFKNIAVVGAWQAVVREAVFGILSATGLGPIIVGTVSSIIIFVWAWLEGKSALDITVYGLATFAAFLFLGRLIVQFFAVLKGKPMTLAIRCRLSLGEIATRWAKETEGHPGAISRNEIMKELLGAVWEGRFEDRSGNSCLILKKTGKRFPEEDDYGSWNRLLLFSALVSRIRNALPGEQLPSNRELSPREEDPPVEWAYLRRRIPWSKIQSLSLAVYDDVDLSAYIEPLLISKADFRRWARRAKRQLPAFWFG